MVNNNLQETWNEAKIAFSKKDYNTAAKLFGEIIIQTNDINAHFNRAVCYFHLKRFKQAIRDMQEIDGKFNKSELLRLRDKIQKAMKEETGDKIEMDKDGIITKLAFFKSDIKFSDVIGCEKAKQFLMNNVVLGIRRPDLFIKYKKRMGEGIILYGPSGSGKTFLAKAVAGESGANMLNIKINNILSMYAGNSERNIATIFDFARKHLPCIIYLDEIDALASKRASGDDTKGEGSLVRNLINQLLTEMDGLEKNPEGIFVLASTNRPADIDAAFKRSGRFSNLIYIAPPNTRERIELFKYYLKGKPIGNLNYMQLAMLTADYSQADICRLCDISLIEPILHEYNSGIERKMSQQDINITLKKMMPKGSLSQWFIDTKNELIGKEIITMVDGKEQKNWKPGNMDNQEKRLYEPLMKDIEKYTSTSHARLNAIQRALAQLLS